MVFAPGRWTGERIKRHGEETYVIQQCDSPLAAHRSERGRRSDDNEGPDHEPRQEAIERRYPRPTRQAKVVSHRLLADREVTLSGPCDRSAMTRHRWIADQLMEFIPEGGYPAVSEAFWTLRRSGLSCSGGSSDLSTTGPIWPRFSGGPSTRRRSRVLELHRQSSAKSRSTGFPKKPVPRPPWFSGASRRIRKPRLSPSGLPLELSTTRRPGQA